MPRRSPVGTIHHTKRQKGNRNRYRDGRGTYSIKGKGKFSERYGRPYLDGTYSRTEGSE